MEAEPGCTVTPPTAQPRPPRFAGEPLLLDVCGTLQRHHRAVDLIIGGRYGLASKDFTPAMALVRTCLPLVWVAGAGL